MEDYFNRIADHHQNLQLNNQRVFAQFKAELRRVNPYLQDSIADKEKYESTTYMETINERSKEAEG